MEPTQADLKARLVASALTLLAGGGAKTVSLRAVARHAGVSEAAPYTHFKGKAGLMAAVAGRGFTDLSARLDAAGPAASEPGARLIAMGRAYVAFALENPALYGLMFGPTGTLEVSDPDYAAASAETFHRLRSAAAACATAEADSDAGYRAAASAWAAVHGLAVLLLDQRLPSAPPDLVETVTETVAKGLAPA